MGSGKAGVAGGVLFTIAVVVSRVGDNCVGAGIRGARVVDDAAGGLGDVARVGRRAADVSGSVPPPRAHWGGDALLKVGEDVAIELLRADSVKDFSDMVAVSGTTRCPRVVDLTTPSAWEALRGGLGVAYAPVVVVGLTAAPDSLLLGLRDVPVTEMARECAAAGARCVFVGCAPGRGAECIAATEDSLRATKLHPQLGPYLAEFVERVARQEPAAAFVGQLALVEGKTVVVVAPGR